MKSKVCLVTGASSGIGKSVAAGLAAMGAQVVMVSRDADRAERARQEIIASVRNAKVEVVLVDFASQQAVAEAADHFNNKFPRLDVLINNAGAHFSRRHETTEGVEMTFAINYLAHFLLTNRLADLLRKSAPCRVINVTGEYHRKGNIHFGNLNLKNSYSASKATCQAQLARVLFTYELARRTQTIGITANCVHPGAIATRILDNDPDASIFKKLLYKLAMPALDPPEKAAETILYLASAPELENVTGRYFINKSAVRSSEKSYHAELALHLWHVSRQLTSHDHAEPCFV